MSKSENTFLKDLRERDLIDERELVFVSDISGTNGNSGRGFWMINGNMLRIYAMQSFGKIGDLIEEIDLNETKFIKGSGFVLHTHLTIEYQNTRYYFTGFAQGKRVIEAMKENCKG